ncbi:MAG: cobyric acid synthase [Nitrospiraceae bacterium]
MTTWPTSSATPAVAVLGTGSDVGKSLIVAGLCRILARAGVRVAPFKAQNMSLNSSVTPDGAEIGRAQALQAEACRIPPHVDMNPILLKPEAEGRSQIVLSGRVYGKTDAEAYFTAGGINRLRPHVESAYRRLADRYEAVVIEGAGSAAEINLREKDLVNWPVVAMADAAVLLVGDIDRGGVFAQLIGTLDLLAPEERARVRGLIVNKFRGDLTLFTDGVRMLEARTGIPVLGVVPYLKDLGLDQEDHLDLRSRPAPPFSRERVNIMSSVAAAPDAPHGQCPGR